MFFKRFIHSIHPLGTQLSLLGLLATLVLACGDTSTDRGSRQAAGHLVETLHANYQEISASRTLSGTLQPVRQVNITTQTQGLLIKLPVYPGDRVKQGQTLAKLDDTLIKAEVQKARASLKQAKVDLRRIKNLAPRKLASESEIAQAQTRAEIAASELQLKQTQLKHTHIQSPIDGIIASRLAEPGDVIPTHTQLLSLIDTSSLKAEIYMSELLLPLIDIGNEVKITIDALGEQQFPGKIKRIYPSIDKDTRRGTIEVSLYPVPQGALAGQLCRVAIHTQSKRRLMIPYDTVRHDNQGAYVYTIKNDLAERINITTGIQQGKLIEVFSGLENNQEIISKGFFGLKNKMRVKRVKPASANSTPHQPNQQSKAQKRQQSAQPGTQSTDKP